MRRSLSSNLNCVLVAVAFSLACPIAGLAQDPTPAPAPAMAPDSSSALATAAWAAYERKDYAAARAAIERCVSLYGKQAAEMQGQLAALPDKESAHQQWALNDVGTCTFVLGQVAEAEGKKDEAMAAYKAVVEKYPFSQCWDEQGWFWQPAVAAKERIAFLTLEQE